MGWTGHRILVIQVDKHRLLDVLDSQSEGHGEPMRSPAAQQPSSEQQRTRSLGHNRNT